MATSIYTRVALAALLAACLAACGGGDDEPDYCELPNGGTSAFAACQQTINPPAGAVVTVTITGQIVATNTTASPGEVNRYVQISFAGSRFQGRYITRTLLAGESMVVPFTLTEAISPETVTNDRPIEVGFNSLEPAHDIDSTVRKVTLTIR